MRIWRALLLLALLLFGGGLGPAGTPAGDRAAAAPYAHAGQERFWVGANLPWYNWGRDIGGGPENGGVRATAETVGRRMAEARQAGIGHVRWWIFPGDAWQIGRDAAGLPTGLHPNVEGDLDAALALAEANDLHLHLVLFSAPSHLPAAWLDGAEGRARLAAALGPLFARYTQAPRLLTWELFNEPEWDIWAGRVAGDDVRALVRELVGAAVANGATAQLSVGSAMVDGLPLWVGLGLGHYRAHWYDYMQPGDWCARCRNAAEVAAQYSLDRPLVIGEFYAGPDSDARRRYQDWLDKGYAGAFAWSLFPERTSDGMTIDLAAVAEFVAGQASAPAPAP